MRAFFSEVPFPLRIVKILDTAQDAQLVVPQLLHAAGCATWQHLQIEQLSVAQTLSGAAR